MNSALYERINHCFYSFYTVHAYFSNVTVSPPLGTVAEAAWPDF
jgi:hypothetical protein